MKIVGEILHFKGRQVWSIESDRPVFEAIELMADKDIGALLIMQGGRMCGIMSERDYARKVILKGESSREITCREIMSEDVVSVSKRHTVEQCMELISRERIRHLPVVEAEEVVGLVSIGDIVQAIISDQEATIEQLERYITGTGQIS